jgi:predicted secreted protein
MTRRLLTAIAATVFFASHAIAGDYADRQIIGFSPNGNFFAFEEYGIQDGSGFPYSNIYLISTAKDSWVAGTPVRVRIDDEAATLRTARDLALSQAQPLLLEHNIVAEGRHVLHNPITEITDAHNAEFLLRAFSPLQTAGWMISIEEFPLPSECPDIGATIVGFDLWLGSPLAGPRQLNHDTGIPDSRGCPVGYGISDVIAFDRPNEAVVIILLNLFTLGFEGPDRRFLAIATTIGE